MKLPEIDGYYKVVQLIINNKPYLVIDNSKHGEMLQKILIGEKITFEKDLRHDFPVPIGDNYTVCGMGMVNLCFSEMIAAFGGMSIDYRIGIEPKHLNLIRSENPEWEIFSF